MKSGLNVQKNKPHHGGIYVNGLLKLTPHFSIDFKGAVLINKQMDPALRISLFIEKDNLILEFDGAVLQVVYKSDFNLDLIARFDFSVDETVTCASNRLHTHLLRSKLDHVKV